jgi:hypothetical protein
MLALTLSMVDDWILRFREDVVPQLQISPCPYSELKAFLGRHTTTVSGIEQDVIVAILCRLHEIPFLPGIPTRRWGIEIGMLIQNRHVTLTSVKAGVIQLSIGTNGYDYMLWHTAMYPGCPPRVYEGRREIIVIPVEDWLPSMNMQDIVRWCRKKSD